MLQYLSITCYVLLPCIMLCFVTQVFGDANPPAPPFGQGQDNPLAPFPLPPACSARAMYPFPPFPPSPLPPFPPYPLTPSPFHPAPPLSRPGPGRRETRQTDHASPCLTHMCALCVGNGPGDEKLPNHSTRGYVYACAREAEAL